MTTPTTRAALGIATIICLTGVAQAQTQELTRTIPMDASGSFSLTNISGTITVTGVDSSDLTIQATKRVRDGASGADADEALRGVEIEIRERGNRVSVETEYGRTRGGGPRVSVDYDVRVPRGASVLIESVSGAVTVDGVDGETRVEVVSGAVRLTSVSRLVEVGAVSGDVELRDVASDEVMEVGLVSGSLTIDGVATPRLETSTIGGAITLTRVDARRVEVETLSGAITFQGPLATDGRYELESHAGRILLTVPDGTGFELEAESFSGNFSSAVPIMVGREGQTREATVFDRGTRQLEGTAGGGGARLELSTFSGSIAIETP